jgi:hypothetical protein
MTPTDEFPKLLDLAMAEVQQETQRVMAAYALTHYPQWGYDERNALLTFADGRNQVVADAQLAGFWYPADARWQWGWFDQKLPEAVSRAARAVRGWGEANGVALLTDPAPAADETLAWKLTAFTARLTGLPAVYRCQSGPRFLYLAFAVRPS